jgi:hypothetical protein
MFELTGNRTKLKDAALDPNFLVDLDVCAGLKRKLGRLPRTRSEQ